MDSRASKFGVLAFVSIFFNLMCSKIPEAVAQPASTTSLVRQVLWTHVVQPLEDPIWWSTRVQYEPKNEEAFQLLVGLTMSFRESSSKLQDMIDSMVVGAALRLAFWFREDELMQMNEHRRYPFSCSGALRALLESVNWWEIRTQINKEMRCLQYPISVYVADLADVYLFQKDLGHMTEKELERLVILIINQQMMDDRNPGHVEYDFSQGGNIQEYVPPLPLQEFRHGCWMRNVDSQERHGR